MTTELYNGSMRVISDIAENEKYTSEAAVGWNITYHHMLASKSVQTEMNTLMKLFESQNINRTRTIGTGSQNIRWTATGLFNLSAE